MGDSSDHKESWQGGYSQLRGLRLKPPSSKGKTWHSTVCHLCRASSLHRWHHLGGGPTCFCSKQDRN